MAETGTRRRSQNGSAEQASEDRKATRRVVLQRVQVLVLPDGVTSEQLDAATKALGASRSKPIVAGQAWLECGVFEGSKVGAIEAYAGKPGTADAKVGTFKAPSESSMRGGAAYNAPPLPKVERELID